MASRGTRKCGGGSGKNAFNPYSMVLIFQIPRGGPKSSPWGMTPRGLATVTNMNFMKRRLMRSIKGKLKLWP